MVQSYTPRQDLRQICVVLYEMTLHTPHVFVKYKWV